MKRFAKYFVAWLCFGILAAVVDFARRDLGSDPIEAARDSALAFGMFTMWCNFKLGWIKP